MKDPKKLYNKVEAKSTLKKYLILLLTFLPILILLNFTLFAKLSSFLMIFLDVVLSLAYVFVGGFVWNNIAEKRRQKKEEEKKKREVEEKLASIASFKASKNQSVKKKKGKRRNRSKNNVQDDSMHNVVKGIENKNDTIKAENNIETNDDFKTKKIDESSKEVLENNQADNIEEQTSDSKSDKID